MNFGKIQRWPVLFLVVTALFSALYATAARANSAAGQSAGLRPPARGFKSNARLGAGGPVIDVWYGTYQVFGQLGVPQQWVNILGNVSDPDGVGTLVYALNGGPASSLSIGPDGKRLVSPGDFNIEIDYQDLLVGPNQVVITATDQLANSSVVTVTVEWVGNRPWPQPYTIDWSTVGAISEVAQIVDGEWTLEADSVRPAVMGYDRLIAIGEMAWKDFEVEVPITIHALQEPNDGGVGIILRWQGHFQEANEQPRTGWWNIGAYGYYRDGDHLALRLDKSDPLQDPSVQLAFGTPYIFKMRVTGTLGEYKLKVWEQGQPEPAAWNMTAQDDSRDLASGSVLLVAHKVDASFGDVTIRPLSFDIFLPVVQR